jgi:hypothetical protein
MMIKTVVSLFVLFILSGCIERDIYTEVADRAIIAHPPQALNVEDPSGMLKTSFEHNLNAPMTMTLIVHCAKCTNAQSKSLGADFDGYIRITVSEGNRTLARAQMDYKGEATPEEVSQVYTHLMERLQWNPSV